jgi:polyhydroxyalkanoate synthesis regulator phasin
MKTQKISSVGQKPKNNVKYKDFFTSTVKSVLLENKKFAAELVKQGKLSSDDFNTLVGFDKTPTKKYVGWMAKQWIINKTKPENEQFTPDDLRNTIEEYDLFVKNRTTDKTDIFSFKTFEELKKEVTRINNMGQASSSEMENDYEVIRDDNDLVIMVQHTHAASRKLGLSVFAYRECPDKPGTKDSAWCTTYANRDHFYSYYYANQITFYYIKVKSDTLFEKVRSEISKKYPEKSEEDINALRVVAVVVYHDSTKPNEAYDGKDQSIKSNILHDFLHIIGVD